MLSLLAFVGAANFAGGHEGRSASAGLSPHAWTSGSPLANLTLFRLPICHSSLIVGPGHLCLVITLQVQLIRRILCIFLGAEVSLCKCVFWKVRPINTRAPSVKVTSEITWVDLHLNWKSLVAPKDKDKIGTPEQSWNNCSLSACQSSQSSFPLYRLRLQQSKRICSNPAALKLVVEN